MEEERINLDTGEYIIQGGQIHVDDNGTSYLIKNGKVVGKNPAQILPEVVVRPKINTPWKAAYLQSKRNPNWRQTYGMSSDLDTFNAVTGGFFNLLSPTQLGRNIYNIATNKPTASLEFIFGNSGLFTDKFAEKHPIVSTIGNVAADILTLGSTKIPKIDRNVYLKIPRNSNRYYRIVGSSKNKLGDAIKDANTTGYLRSNRLAHPEPPIADGVISLQPKRFDYLMFSKGKPWEGSTNGAGSYGRLNSGQRVIRSKLNVGDIVWEESNKDFRHKGHKGIFRPNYNGSLELIPSKYFEYFERGSGPISKHLWYKKDFDLSRILQSRNIIPRTNTSHIPSKRYIPDIQGNFLYNAFLDSHFYNKEVKDLIRLFLKNRNMKALEDILPTLEGESKEQLNNFIKTYKFQGLRIPYYTNLDDLLREHPIIARNIPKTDFVNIDDAFIHTDGDKAIILSNYKNAPHEAEHYLQSRRFFSETGSPYMQKLEALLNKAYKHSLRRGIPDAELVEEKGAVNQQLRTHIIENFRNENGRYPTLKELETAIDSFPESKIKSFLNSVNLYGREYVGNMLDYRQIRQALKYVGTLGVPVYITTKGED